MAQEELSKYSKQVAKGTLWSLSGNVVFHLISFFYVILIARAVSQDDLGLYFLAFSVVSISAVFDNFGLGSALTRYIPFYTGRGEKGKIRSLVNISYVVIIIAALIIMGIIWLLSDYVGELYQNPALPDLIRLLSVYLLLSNVFNLNNAFLQGRADIKAMKLSQTSQNALKLAFTALFFYLFGASIFTLVAAFLLSFVFSIALSALFMLRRAGDLPSGQDKVEVSLVLYEIMPFGLMMTLILSTGAIFSSANRMLLGYLVGPAQMTQIIAIYAVSATLSGLLLTLPRSIGDIFLPIISRLFGKGDLSQVRKVTQTSQRWAMFLTVPFGVVFISLSGDILSLVYGEAYRGGALVMSILTAAYLIRTVSLMLTLTLSAMKKLDVQLRVAILSGIIQVTMGLLLIPLIGMEGAALGTFVSMLLSFFLLLYYSRKYFDFHIPFEIYKLMGAGLATLIIMVLISPYTSMVFGFFPEQEAGGLSLYVIKLISLAYVGVLAGAAMAMFLLFILLLKCFTREDISMMKKSLEKIRIPQPIILLIVRLASYGLIR